MKSYCSIVAVVIAISAMVGCKALVEPTAAATKNGTKNPVKENIESVKTNAAAAVAAADAKTVELTKQAAIVAASVVTAQTVNSNQPAGTLTEFVDKELKLVLGRLPKPDTAELLLSEQRKVAILTEDFAKRDALYRAAETESERMKSENTRLTKANSAQGTKLDAAVAALVAADKNYEAQLVANEAKNQARLDAAEARAKKSEDDRKNAETKEQVKWLRIIGLACLVAGIGIGVMTNGLQLAKSIGFGACALACFGLAQIVAHPWFLPVSIGCVVLAACGGGYWFWRERKDAFKVSSMEKQVKVLDGVENLEAVPVKREDGTLSNLATELSKKMNDPEKAMVKQIRLAQAVKTAKAEAKA